LFRSTSSSRLVTVIVGVIVPLALVTGAAWLHLGWMSARRRRLGRCPNCRHVLQPTGDEVVERCQECNWRPAA
jgi:hypothetical protein